MSEQRGALRLVWLLTHDQRRADDLVQDAFTSIMVRLDELEHPADRFGSHCRVDQGKVTVCERLGLAEAGFLV